MRLFRQCLVAALILAMGGLSGCLTGSGSGGLSPAAPAGLPAGASVPSPSSPGGIFTGDSGPSSPSGGGAPAAGGSDTMPPRADAGDCMNLGLDGSRYCGPPLQEACRISYVPVAGLKVLPGNTGAPAPLNLPSTTTLNARFYAETGSAPMSCTDPSCWTWQPVGEGTYVRMRLSRNQPAAPQLQYYQDAPVEAIGADGGNVFFGGGKVQTDDQLDFYYTFHDSPYGLSASLVPLTDDVWTEFGVQCDMGSFKVDTGVTTYRKLDTFVPPRGLDIPFK